MRILVLIITLSIINVTILGQTKFEDQKTIHDIDSIRARFHIPAVAFGVANCDSIIITGAAGIREINTTDSVTINDKFHIASLGKGLLAFIAGKLIDEGKISWNTRFFDLFPEMKETSGIEYQDMELKDLLSHRTQLKYFNDWGAKQIIDGFNQTCPNDRFSVYKFSKYALTLEPAKYNPGQFYRYTSMGYLLASLMLEKASGLKYKQLLEETNLNLGINFLIGWPTDYDKSQPKGHLIPAESGWGESNKLEVLNGDSFTDWGEDFLFY